MLEDFLAGPSASPARELEVIPSRGAYIRIDPSATPFPHRRELFLLKHDVTVPASAADPRPRPPPPLARTFRRLLVTGLPLYAGGV
jgi:hypothetical protein